MIIKHYQLNKPVLYLIRGTIHVRDTVKRVLKRFFKYLGKVYKNHNFTLHCLRNSYATHLLEAGVNLTIETWNAIQCSLDNG